MRSASRFAFVSSVALLVIASSAATASSGCSSSSSSDPGAGDAGADTATTPGAAKQKGRIIDGVDKFGVAGATVTIAGKSVVTKEDGTYEIEVPRDKPYRMSVTEAEHWKLNEQEWIVKKDLFDRTDTSLLSISIGNLLVSFIGTRDMAKGVLFVRVNPLPPCDSEQGAKVALETPGASKVTYFMGGRPDKTATSTTKDEAFSALISDIDVGVPLKVIIDSPTCAQMPFPVDYQDVTYTGGQQAEAGMTLSYIRTFISAKR